MGDAAPVEPERRDGRPDRRRQPTPMLSRHTFFGGRRCGERRAGSVAEGFYADRHPAWQLVLLLSLYALNLLDAHFTLVQLANGAVEINPVARALLEIGPRTFVVVKALGIGLILCFLCLHTHFKRGRMVLIFGIAVYFVIVVYHVVSYAIVMGLRG